MFSGITSHLKEHGFSFCCACSFAVFSLVLSLGALWGCRVNTTTMPDTTPALQTTRMRYNCDDVRSDFGATLTNRGPMTIEVTGACDFLVYRRTEGWNAMRVIDRRSSPVDPRCYQPLTIAPGKTIRVEPVIELVWQTMNACNERYLLGAPYTVEDEASGTLGVIYTEFDVGDSPPEDVGSLRDIVAELIEPPNRIRVRNHRARGSLWIFPFCSEAARELAKVPTPLSELTAYATLERKTDWGSWEIIQPDPLSCTQNPEQIEVGAGSEENISLWQGSGFDWQQLEPGWYRWHVVYFSQEYGSVPLTTLGQHRFLEVFEVQDE